MKRNLFCLIVTFAVGILTASVPARAAGEITLNFQYAGKVTIGLAGSEWGGDKVTINWGDGTPIETRTLNFSMIPIYHNYTGATPRTITITGDNIRGIVCADMQLTSLDVSKCPTLNILDCSRNKLTSIDLSKNTSLVHLTCTHNQLTALDLSKITWIGHIRCSYNQLTNLDLSHNVLIKNLWVDNNPFTTASMESLFRSMHNNVPNGGKILYVGTTSANVNIASDSGWTIVRLAN